MMRFGSAKPHHKGQSEEEAMRSSYLRPITLILVALMLLAACGASSASPGAAPTAAPAAPSSGDLQVDKSRLSAKLSVYNWADYIDPGTIQQFKDEYGVDVTVDVYDNNEDMIAKVRTGNSGYDVVFPSDYA